jgi:DNA primase
MEATLPCMEDGRQARFLFLPEGEDPDTVVRDGGAESFGNLLAGAVPLEEFLFESVSRKLDTQTLDGRARLSKLALPYIRQLPEGVFRQLMFQSLAERTGLELASLMQLEAPPPPPEAEPAPMQYEEVPPLESVPEPEHAGPRQRPTLAAEASGGAHSNLAQSAIALLLHQPDIARLADTAPLAELAGEDVTLLRELLELLQRRPDSSTAMLLGHWYGTPQGELLNQLAGQERLIPTAGIEQQFLDTMSALAQLPQRSRLAAQVDKLKLTNYAEVSELEKQQLRELLREKQQQDSQRRKQ